MMRKPVLTVSEGYVAMQGPRSQLRWCDSDCQSGSWMVGEGTFLNSDHPWNLWSRRVGTPKYLSTTVKSKACDSVLSHTISTVKTHLYKN